MRVIFPYQTNRDLFEFYMIGYTLKNLIINGYNFSFTDQTHMGVPKIACKFWGKEQTHNKRWFLAKK